MNRRWRVAGCAVFAAATLGFGLAASADGVRDGQAGLLALNRGAYAQAVNLFTKAINVGDLSPDDREFAYLNRGKAYQGEGDQARALADFQEAARLKPDDTEAQDALHHALAAQSPSGTDAPRAGYHDPWGLLRTMAGNYYWYEVPGSDPHRAYAEASWVTSEQTLVVSIRMKGGLLGATEYKLDSVTGDLLVAGVSGSTQGNVYTYGTAEAAAAALRGYAYMKSIPVQTTSTIEDDGSIRETMQQFQDGSWHDMASAQFVEVPKETLQADGLIKGR